MTNSKNKNMKKSAAGRCVSRSKLRHGERGPGVEAFFKATGLSQESAKEILEGSNAVSGCTPVQARRYRESLIAFKWQPN